MNYDVYVWACYVLAALVVGGLVSVSVYDMVRQKKLLDRYHGQKNEFS